MALSIHARQTLAAGGILFCSVAAVGYALERANRHSLEVAHDSELSAQLQALLTIVEVQRDGTLTIPSLLDVRLNTVNSGLVAAIYDDHGQREWQSMSSLSQVLPPAVPTSIPGQPAVTEVSNGEERYRQISQSVSWRSAGNERIHTLQVAERLAILDERLSAFRATLWSWLWALSAALMVGLTLVLRWSLSPLEGLSEDVRKVESGLVDGLGGDYPSEVEAVTTRMSSLIAAEQSRKQRLRHSLGDLAHSFKTPLAALQGMADSGKPIEAARLSELVQRMNDIVRYQLQRAVSGGVGLMSEPVGLVEPLYKLVNSLKKVYFDRDLQIDIVAPAEIFYPIDRGEFMELTGNLLENACKWCRARVRVSIVSDQAIPGVGRAVVLRIEDDGPGIPQQKVDEVLVRGARLDSSQGPSGQGIGLAMVSDIVDGLDGRLTFGESELGGLLVSVALPERGRSA
ncbi:ATP-binding protein [Gammaproteobacteria bacterium]|nr:ATP-binding protein [Gammaproteobacteria bacterium]